MDTPDFIPDSDFKPDTSAHGSDFIPDSQFVSDEDKYGSIGQQALTGLEGAGQGFAGPVATGVELGLSKLGVPGLTAEDIAGRAAANPWIHGLSEAGGLGVGLLTGTGEAGLIAKAGEVAAQASKLGKVGSAAIKGAVEAGTFQGMDETSKAMLGQGDPEAPVSSALVHIGAASLLGGGIGGVFGKLGIAGNEAKDAANARVGSKTTQFMEDFGNQWNIEKANPNMAESVTNELTNFHNNMREMADEVYGSRGLKSMAIEKTVPKEVTGEITKQNQDIANKLQSKLTDMVGDTDTYPAQYIKKFQKDINQWQEIATDPAANPNQIFNATQLLKQKFQHYADYEKRITPFAPEAGFVNLSREMGSYLRESLEDSKVWDKAADLQKNINKAFVGFKAPNKDFNQQFTTKLLGEPTVDPAKINTYINQAGKPTLGFKPEKLQNYVEAAENYKDKINELHHSLGLESPIMPASLNAVKSTMGEISPGAAAATALFRSGIPKVASKMATTAAGIGLGHMTGMPGGELMGGLLAQPFEQQLKPLFEKAIGRPIKNYLVPSMLKVLGSDSPQSMGPVLEHAESVAKGANKIKDSIDAIFKVGGQQSINAEILKRDREKLKETIENGGANNQIKEEAQKEGVAQGFAEGGEVKKQDNSSGIARIYPDQSMMMSAAKTRITNYLNSVRPLPNQSKLPYDTEIKSPAKERTYDRALDIANHPLSVLNNVRNGTLVPEHVRHLNSLYPELHNHLAKKLTERITQNQIDEEKPSYKVRQSMSLLMGTPLNSNLTPASIMAAQSVFMQQKAQQAQMPVKNKKGTASLTKMSENHLTQDQSRIERANKG